jgi:3-dehydrosphinganine reductase
MRFFKGKKVLITGGSSGIGKAAAIQLAKAGADVAIIARDQARLDTARGEIERAANSSAQRIVAYSVDVRDREAVVKMVSEVLEGLGGLDVAIINQGYAVTGFAHEMDDEQFDDMMATNYMGHVYVTRALLPHMRAQKSGHICLVSSMLGFMAFTGYSAYAASKHAVAGFARALRSELAPHISVSICYPPTTDTPGLAKENENKPAEVWALEQGSKAMQPEAVADEMLRGIADGKFEMVPGLGNRLIWLAYRYSPWLVDWVMDNDLKKFRAKQSSR